MSRLIPGIKDRIIPRSSGIPASNQAFGYKTRFAALGTVGSGKSTVFAGIVLTAETLSGQRTDFFCRVLQNQTQILTDASNLRRGRFPKKTMAYQNFAPEAGLLLKYNTTWGEKFVQIPLCDVAGEDLQQMVARVRNNQSLDGNAFAANANVINYVKESQGFILVIPASRALIFHDDQQLERESIIDEGDPDRVVDPDPVLHEILSEVITYKQQTKSPIKGIAVVITKWDLIAPYAQNWGMDLYDTTGNGMRTFMEICFPGTMMELKAAGLDKVRFFPSHFQACRNPDGTVLRWPDGGDKIETIAQRRVPKYSERSYVDLFDWLKGFAA